MFRMTSGSVVRFHDGLGAGGQRDDAGPELRHLNPRVERLEEFRGAVLRLSDPWLPASCNRMLGETSRTRMMSARFFLGEPSRYGREPWAGAISNVVNPRARAVIPTTPRMGTNRVQSAGFPVGPKASMLPVGPAGCEEPRRPA